MSDRIEMREHIGEPIDQAVLNVTPAFSSLGTRPRHGGKQTVRGRAPEHCVLALAPLLLANPAADPDPITGCPMNCTDVKAIASGRATRHRRCGPLALFVLALASAVSAEAGAKAAIAIKLPPSDVVDSHTPYRLEVSLADAIAGGAAELSVEVQDQGSGAAAQGPIRGKLRIPPSTTRGLGPVKLFVDASSLADGEYTGKVVLRSGGHTAEKAIAFFRMAENRPDHRALGIYAMDIPALPALDASLGKLKEMGITILAPHAFGLRGANLRLMDRAARLGLRVQPALHLWRREDRHGPEADFVIDSAGKTHKQGCLNRPSTRKRLAEIMGAFLREHLSHPAFSGTIYTGDDCFLPGTFREGKAHVSCYCDYCRRDFREATDLEAPPTATPTGAIVGTGDPWLRWMRYRCETSYGGFIKALEAMKDRIAPEVRIGLAHGAPDNPFVTVSTGLYAPLTQQTDVVSSYCYPFLRSPVSDLICHYEIGRMGNRDKPVWMLGIFSADNTVVPGWQVRLNYWNMLAAGYQRLAFFSWYQFWPRYSDKRYRGRARLVEAVDALSRCGAHKDWILPAAQHWTRPRAPFAMLYSFTTEAFDVSPNHRGNRHSKRLCELYRLALRHQLPMDVICEEEVRNGILDEYEAVCLHDVRRMPDDVHRIVGKYAKLGERVLVAPDYRYTDAWHPNASVQIEGALAMAPETMIAVLGDRVGRPVTVSGRDIIVRRFESSDLEYYVFVNTYTDRYWGLYYSYRDAAANHEKAALVRDEPASAEVQFAAGGRWLFDMYTGEPAGKTDDPMTLSLEPSWGRALVSLPTPSAALKCTVPRSAKQGDTVAARLEMLGPDGKRLKGTFAARITAQSPSGQTSRYSDFISIHGGLGEFSLPLGVNAELGRWVIVVEGGFPRQASQHAVTVRAGPEPSLPVRIVAE